MKITLRDCQANDTFINFLFLSHTPDPDEGSYLEVSFFNNSKLERTSEFGWANRVLYKFIEILKNFPVNDQDGHYSHFEKHFNLRWIHENATGYYLIIIEDVGNLFTLKVTKDDLVNLGKQLEIESYKAPKYLK
ncbi:hypothetical protein [Bacillus sp. FJAT-28004]|uniref:hypothetical protein n=1 Tax=Bacillus sp. FJAT-28004 TaxID=1679165 RepID=UPI0006B64CBD|nr:hypothetical protein [Bacillus sp. FJAT-28004]